LKVYDIDSNSLSLTSFLVVNEISGNIFKVTDVSANNVSLTKDLNVTGDMLGKKLNVTDVGANNLSLNGRLNVTGDISGNKLKVTDVSANNLSLTNDLYVTGTIYGHKLSVTDISANNLSLKGYLNIIGDICGNKLNATDINAKNMSASGVVRGPLIQWASDYRIKENVINLSSTLGVDNLRPIQYYNILTQKNDFGFIAHEIQAEYPDLVNGAKDCDGYQSVNYVGLISVLINELKELKSQLKYQQDKTTELLAILKK
jgi:hypothetical protein